MQPKRILSLFLTCSLASAGELTTEVYDSETSKRLGGDHFLALQWISWKNYGVAKIRTSENEQWTLEGQQLGADGDFLKLKGVITEVRENRFLFSGAIITKVSHIAGGKEVKRAGLFNFLQTGTRKYWRMQEMQNPEDDVIDYVDIFFLKYSNH